jgi:hypothetical protein
MTFVPFETDVPEIPYRFRITVLDLGRRVEASPEE